MAVLLLARPTTSTALSLTSLASALRSLPSTLVESLPEPLAAEWAPLMRRLPWSARQLDADSQATLDYNNDG